MNTYLWHLPDDSPGGFWAGCSLRTAGLFYCNPIYHIWAGITGGEPATGSRVGYLGHNHPDAIVAVIAASAIGAIFVPLNARLTQAELAYIIGDADIDILLVERSCQARMESLRPDLSCRLYMAIGGAASGWDDIDGHLSSADADWTTAAAEPSDVAVIVYTSGTTGRPKGAMLTHRNL